MRDIFSKVWLMLSHHPNCTLRSSTLKLSECSVAFIQHLNIRNIQRKSPDSEFIHHDTGSAIWYHDIIITLFKHDSHHYTRTANSSTIQINSEARGPACDNNGQMEPGVWEDPPARDNMVVPSCVEFDAGMERMMHTNILQRKANFQRWRLTETLYLQKFLFFCFSWSLCFCALEKTGVKKSFVEKELSVTVIFKAHINSAACMPHVTSTATSSSLSNRIRFLFVHSMTLSQTATVAPSALHWWCSLRQSSPV